MSVKNINEKNTWFTHEPRLSDFNSEANIGNDCWLVLIAIGRKNILVGDYDFELKKFNCHCLESHRNLELNQIVSWQPISGYPNCL
jgi:hypothetical protein